MSQKKVFAALTVTLFAAMVIVFAHYHQTNKVDPDMMKLIKSSVGKDPRLFSDTAHEIGHTIAHVNSSLNLKNDLLLCGDPNAFFGGCLHGVVMGLADSLSAGKLAGECKAIAKFRDIFGSECAHGVGHVLYGDNSKIETAGCQSLFSGQLYHDCISGVFMEAMLGTHKAIMSGNQGQIQINKLNCKTIDSTIQMDCAAATGSYMLYYTSSDPKQAALECTKPGTKELSDYCAQAALYRLSWASTSTKQAFTANFTD